MQYRVACNAQNQLFTYPTRLMEVKVENDFETERAGLLCWHGWPDAAKVLLMSAKDRNRQLVQTATHSEDRIIKRPHAHCRKLLR